MSSPEQYDSEVDVLKLLLEDPDDCGFIFQLRVFGEWDHVEFQKLKVATSRVLERNGGWPTWLDEFFSWAPEMVRAIASRPDFFQAPPAGMSTEQYRATVEDDLQELVCLEDLHAARN